jgi:hypothetical protein
MAEQRLHSGLAPIDVLTCVELEQSLNKEFDTAVRQRFLGMELQRFPRTITEAASSGNLNIGAIGNNMAPIGPEQGDIWSVRRVIVKSSVRTDSATYFLFRGSAPSDAQNAYGIVNLLDQFTAAGVGLPVSVGFYPGNKSLYLQPGEQIYAMVLGVTAGVTYMLDGEAIRCPAEMKGKIL